MATLTEFLLERYAEEEEAAYVFIEPQPGYAPRPEDHPLVRTARRVLAECEAKRRLLDLHATDVLVSRGFVGFRGSETLRLLALPYTDHPDFDPRWRV